MISLNSLPVKLFYYHGYSFTYKCYYFLFRGVYLPDANLFVVIIPPEISAAPTQNNQEKRSCKIMSERITAKTGIRYV